MIGLYVSFLLVVNHIIVTLIRAYFRTERLKMYYLVDPHLLGIAIGVKRRILRPSTIFTTLVLTLIEISVMSL